MFYYRILFNYHVTFTEKWRGGKKVINIVGNLIFLDKNQYITRQVNNLIMFE